MCSAWWIGVCSGGIFYDIKIKRLFQMQPQQLYVKSQQNLLK